MVGGGAFTWWHMQLGLGGGGLTSRVVAGIRAGTRVGGRTLGVGGGGLASKILVVEA